MTTHESGNVRGADDIELQAAIGRAVLAARGDMSQSDVARATSIDQPTLSKLELGRRRSPLTVWEMRAIERATGRTPGFILEHVGYLPRRLTARQAIAGEPTIPSGARVALVGALDAALAYAAATEGGDAPGMLAASIHPDR